VASSSGSLAWLDGAVEGARFDAAPEYAWLLGGRRLTRFRCGDGTGFGARASDERETEERWLLLRLVETEVTEDARLRFAGSLKDIVVTDSELGFSRLGSRKES
jgi:hypothetical protein